ncbi:MAG: 3-deoxy-D-manno-octulosonic acid transferase [Chitinophagaceae bacterium]|nr:3-deoxy-D-manno-octulosonic acid transferase [Chitinophagaceae bacterium]
MPVFFYHIFLLLFKAAAFITSPFNSKTKKWVTGRKDLFEKLHAAIPADAKIVWMHCSSLGEFEQGRPVLEKIRSQYPRYKVLLTFFSPSGYEVQKNYDGADWVFYLPMDGRSNAKRFAEIVHPSLVIFVKYDLWYFYLKEINKRNIPLLLISALIEKSKVFKWYGRMHRKMFGLISHFFVQDAESKKLLDKAGFSNSTVAGDTRFDRVIEIAEKFEPIPLIENFITGHKTIIAGSTWQEDDIVLKKTVEIINDPSLKLIIAPHELGERNLNDLKKLFPNSIRYSQLSTPNSQLSTCLIIDNIGILSRLYKYGDITFVGGGMTSYGVHNVLEAAVYSKPVIIGPFYKKYIEAIGLVDCGGALVIKNEKELAVTIRELLTNTGDSYIKSAKASGNFVQQNAGADRKILQFIQENRLLTN